MQWTLFHNSTKHNFGPFLPYTENEKNQTRYLGSKYICYNYTFCCSLRENTQSFASNGDQQREDTFISAKKRTFAHKSDSMTENRFLYIKCKEHSIDCTSALMFVLSTLRLSRNAVELQTVS